jgi:catechol 2,3-dioxygenase-like lactoylglutathione lyase family enzyme
MPIGTKNKLIAGCGLHHVAIQCRNMDQSLHFYRDVLGMPVTLEFNLGRPIALVDLGDGGCIELIAPANGKPADPIAHTEGHPIMHIALTASDTRAATEMVRKAGYAILDEPKDILLNTLKVTNSFFLGPNDEHLEFFQVHD